MRSRASVRGHPIHPALVPFPFAFLYGALAFDVAGLLAEQPELWITGAHLAVAGVLAGLLAAVPGLVDYRYSVPPKSTGKQRATKHMIANISALALFSLARWLRGDAAVAPEPILLGMEALGAIALTFGGWMGGTLVMRNQIGVDHRYAGAGKWNEEKGELRGDDIVVRLSQELGMDHMCLVRAGKRRLVLGRTERGYVAFDDRCTHRGASLADGVMICGTVQCPWHGSQFDARTGAVRAGPAEEGIGAYAVSEKERQLWISMQPDTANQA